jgi:hypothetical protein
MEEESKVSESFSKTYKNIQNKPQIITNNKGTVSKSQQIEKIQNNQPKLEKLKEERKDQEKIIDLLRKMINDEDKIDRMILKEMEKRGDERERLLTYEELKIKIKNLEAQIFHLKKNSTSLKKTINKTKNKEENDEISEMSSPYKILEERNERIRILEEENNLLLSAKDKMESLQSDLFEKIKSYNTEIGEMKSVYDAIKHNFEQETNLKLKDLESKLKLSTVENSKLKEKIKELITISETNSQTSSQKITKLESQIEVLKRVLESKKVEIQSLTDELTKYQIHLEKIDGKDIGKNLKFEKEKTEIQKQKIENEEKIKFLEKTIKIKDLQIEGLKKGMQDKDDIMNEKDMEIQLLQSKMEELEKIFSENYKKMINR